MTHTHPCPTCNQPITNPHTICKQCTWQYQTDCTQLAALTPDLTLITTKQANPNPHHNSARGNQGVAPLPLRTDAFDLQSRIREYAVNASLLLGLKPGESDDVAVMLRAIAALHDVDRSPVAPQLAATARELAGEVWAMFEPREPRTFAGHCPACNAGIYAPLASKAAYCSQCGQLVDLTWLREETLRRLRSSRTTKTAGELSEWLTSWGLKVSKRTIQRWAQEGKIVVGPEDANGRRTYQIGSIIKRFDAGDL
ncbi:hypothetical protein [Bifidobacterium biavatii]|uniref:PhnA protein n=1 Tax=Bifidobacterium biavatii DSM 23969 TaxID=1437608 RepID=A0A086ZTU6_9BIFI|nr:hypothetical protein [Bifidobacterium biavatii]KFI49946.1 PhnA protein [Bifidobacterium biavatii DSM 23969]